MAETNRGQFLFELPSPSNTPLPAPLGKGGSLSPPPSSSGSVIWLCYQLFMCPGTELQCHSATPPPARPRSSTALLFHIANLTFLKMVFTICGSEEAKVQASPTNFTRGRDGPGDAATEAQWHPPP